MSILSSHILDTSAGKPAVSVLVELFKEKQSGWASWHSTMTNGDGRVQFPFARESMGEGTYKLKFHVEDYYKKEGKDCLYPYVEISFRVKDGERYHIPLLLTPYAFSTYRGS